MEYIPVRVSDIIRKVNHDLYLPAIQREFVWGTTGIERLFDSINGRFSYRLILVLETRTKEQGRVAGLRVHSVI
jgi:hypothetical protein